MKKIFLYLNFIILIMNLGFCKNKTSTIIGEGIRIRTFPDVNAEIIGFLQTGESIEILDISTKYILANEYYGRWVKIKTLNSKTGFILSCFIKDLEQYPFHLFFNKFIIHNTSVEKQKFLPSIIKYPFKYSVRGFEGVMIHEINSIQELPIQLFIGDGHEEPLVFTLSEDIIRVYKKYDSGCSNTWYFKFIGNSWQFLTGEYTTY
jgi:hypothetical protein